MCPATEIGQFAFGHDGSFVPVFQPYGQNTFVDELLLVAVAIGDIQDAEKCHEENVEQLLAKPIAAKEITAHQGFQRYARQAVFLLHQLSQFGQAFVRFLFCFFGESVGFFRGSVGYFARN